MFNLKLNSNTIGHPKEVKKLSPLLAPGTHGEYVLCYHHTDPYP